MQHFVGFREPIVMIRKRGRVQVSQPEQGVVDRGVARLRWAARRVRRQILEWPLGLGHFWPGCEELAAALRGGFRLEDLVAVLFLGVMVAADFLAGAFFVAAFLAGADFAVRASLR